MRCSFTKDTTTGIILAGGRSSRLGQDKGFVRFRGRTLAEHAIQILAPFCSSLLISSDNPRYREFSWPVVPDLEPGKGPMMGLYSCLKCSATDHNLVLAVDNFLVTVEFFSYLAAKPIPLNGIAVPLVSERFHEPLVGYYSKSTVPVMEAMMDSGNYRLPDLFGRVPFLELDVERDFPAGLPDFFRSLNTAEDLLFMKSLG